MNKSKEQKLRQGIKFVNMNYQLTSLVTVTKICLL